MKKVLTKFTGIVIRSLGWMPSDANKNTALAMVSDKFTNFAVTGLWNFTNDILFKFLSDMSKFSALSNRLL